MSSFPLRGCDVVAARCPPRARHGPPSPTSVLIAGGLPNQGKPPALLEGQSVAVIWRNEVINAPPAV
eukprot:4227251-Pyramimonas_sp.AAC.1